MTTHAPHHPHYADSLAWKQQQVFLPEEFRLTVETAPVEEYWTWRGHQIHLDRYAAPEAPAKLITHHGVGTNGRQMSLIVGAPLHAAGFETVSLDNLGYGMTEVAAGEPYTYDDWVDLVVDFVKAEKARDDRPTFLYGLSAGGLLVYHVAAKLGPGVIAGVIGMTFIDPRLPQVRRETALTPMIGRMASVLQVLARTPLKRARMPMRWVVKMYALVNDRAALKAFLSDPASAGAPTSLAFLSSYLTYTPALEPEEFNACPILLTQPAKDRWTPLHVSQVVLDRISAVTVRVIMLENAGHYPLEQPGINQMNDAITTFIKDLS